MTYIFPIVDLYSYLNNENKDKIEINVNGLLKFNKETIRGWKYKSYLLPTDNVIFYLARKNYIGLKLYKYQCILQKHKFKLIIVKNVNKFKVIRYDVEKIKIIGEKDVRYKDKLSVEIRPKINSDFI